MNPESFKELIYFLIIVIGIAITFGTFSALNTSKKLRDIYDRIVLFIIVRPLEIGLLILATIILIYITVRIYLVY